MKCITVCIRNALQAKYESTIEMYKKKLGEFHDHFCSQSAVFYSVYWAITCVVDLYNLLRLTLYRGTLRHEKTNEGHGRKKCNIYARNNESRRGGFGILDFASYIEYCCALFLNVFYFIIMAYSCKKLSHFVM